MARPGHAHRPVMAMFFSVAVMLAILVLPASAQTLSGYWPFNEGSGTTAADNSGGGHTAALANGVAWTTGQFGGAISTNGANQFATIPAITLTTSRTVTVMGWVNRTYSTAGGHVLFENSSNYGTSSTGFAVFPDDASCSGIQAALRGNVGSTINCYNPPSSGVWHHLAFIFDKTQVGRAEVAFYLDGVLQAPTSTLATATNTNAFGANPTYLMSRAGTSQYAAGAMDDLRIYSGAITAARIQQIAGMFLASLAVTPANTSIAKGTTEQLTATGTYSDGSSQNLTNYVTWNSLNPLVATVNSGGLAIGTGIGVTVLQANSGAVVGSTGITVTAPTLVSLAVTPTNPSIAKGTTLQFTATGTYTDGSTQNLTNAVTWASLTGTVASISTTGLATARATGSSIIRATSGTVTASTTLSVTPALLVSVAVTPANPSVAKGLTKQFTATGTYTDGTTQNLTSTATWTSSAPAVATVSGTGLASTIATGTTTIQATSGSVSGATTLSVTPPTLVSIAVTPANGSVPKGATQQMTATGTYTDGSTQNLTTTVTWASTTTSVATITTGGLISAKLLGTTTIRATSGAITGSTSLTVAAPALASIAVVPANISIAKGTTRQFTATGTYTDGTTQNLTSTVTWASTNPAVATITSAGLASGVTPGSSTIQATSGSITGSTSLGVTSPTLVSVAVTPANASVAKGATQQFTATGTYTDGSTQNLTTTVTWVSTNPAVATISGGGLASGVTQGTSTIQATSAGSVRGSTTLTITPPALVSILVAPANSSIAKGTTQQFTATGIFTDGTTQNLTSTSTWVSTNPAVATITNGGLASGVTTGTTTIQATSGSVSGSTILTVTPPTLVSVVATPANSSIAKGNTQQFTATGTYTDGTTQNLTSTATWVSTNPAVATITRSGLASGVAQGNSTIQATSGSITGSTTLTVTAPTLVSVAVTPANSSITKGTTQQFAATGTYSDSTTQDLTTSATWASTTPSVATITGAGLASGMGTGNTTIQATSGSVSGSTTLTVTPPTLISIAVTPANSSIGVSVSRQFTATGTYSDTTTQDLTTSATWTSTNPSAATINTSGLVTAIATGSTTIQASWGSIVGSTNLTVAAPVTGLVGDWRFDDGSGNTAVDASGNGYTANLINGVSWVTGEIGDAVSANGSNQYVSVPAIDLSHTNAVTVAMWVNRTYSTNGGHTLFENTANYNSSVSGFGIFPDDHNCQGFMAGLHGDVGYTINCYAQPSSGVWHHLVVVYDKSQQGSNEVAFYIDGVLQVPTQSPSSSTNSNNFGNNPSYLFSRGGTAEFSAGAVDELHIYNRALSPAEIVEVYNRALLSLAVAPSNASIAVGATQQFAAIVTYSDGSTQDLSSSATWSSANPAIATVSSSGLATGVSTGSTAVQAAYGSMTANATLAVTPAPTLVSVAVTPATPTIVSGTTQQFTAIGTFSDSSTRDLTTSVTWSSSSVSVATISSTGLATAVSPGSTAIQATSGTISGSATLTVNPPPTLVSIAVSPVNATIPAGATQQYTAIGTYSDTSTQNLTNSVIWTSTNTAAATVGVSGLVTGVAEGTATIQATSGSVMGSAGLTVGPPFPSVSYDLWIDFEQCSSGQAPTSVCLANSTHGTAAGTWSVTNLNGNVTVQPGAQAPDAGLGDTGQQGMSVNVANGTPGYVEFALANPKNTLSFGLWYKTGSPSSYGTNVVYFASFYNASYGPMERLSDERSGGTNARQIRVGPYGVAIPVADDTWYWCTLKHVQGGVGSFSVYDTSLHLVGTVSFTDTTNVTIQTLRIGQIDAATQPSESVYLDDYIVDYTTAHFPLLPVPSSLVSLAVTPANASITTSSTQQFTATGTYTDGSTQDLTSTATWISTNTAVATITSTGLASAVATGSTSVQATSGAISSSTNLTVVPPPTLVSIAVTPANIAIVAGVNQQYLATGTYSDGTTQNLTNLVTWVSGNPAVATISNAGLATAASPGTTSIQAASGSITGSTGLTVNTPPTLVSIAVTPANASINGNASQQYTAIGTYSDGTTQNLTLTVVWSSSNIAIATIDSTGLATALAAGSTTIQATSASITGSTGLTVNPPPTLVSIALAPASPTVGTNGSLQFAAIGTYSDQSTQNITNSATWSSANPTIATVNGTGLASGVSAGATTIQATSGAITGLTTLYVATGNFPWIPYDMWIDFEQDTVGSGMSVSELAASTHGASGAWTVVDPNSLLTTQLAGEDTGHAVTGDSGSRGMAYNLANGGTGNIQWTLPAAQSSLSFGLWYQTGQPAPWTEGPHFVTLYNLSTGPMLRLSDERSSYTNARQIRVSPLDQAVTGIADNTWYWLTMKWTQNGPGTFSVYDSSLHLVGTVNFTDTFNSTLQAFLLGNSASTPGEVGTTTHYDDLLVDYTRANFPLLPQIPASINLGLNPTTVTSGGTSTGTVTLSVPAPNGGATVALSSSNAAVASVPATVTVLAGTTTGSFVVNTGSVTFSTPVTISASYNNLTANANLSVIPTSMAQIASDNFNRANTATLGTNWTPLIGVTTNGALQVVGDQVQSTALNPSVGKEMYFGGLTWAPDQYSEAQIVTAGGNGYVGPAVRMTSNDTHYACVVFNTGVGNAAVSVLMDVAGNYSTVAGSTSSTVNPGDTIRCTVQGNVITMTDQTTSSTLLVAADNTIASGYPGLVDAAGSVSLTNYVMTNWAAGALAAPMALQQIASDNFNRVDALNLGPNWHVGTGHGPIQIVSQQMQPYPAGGPQPSKEHYVAAGPFPNDQWSQIQVVVEDLLGDNAVELRASDTADTLYVLDVNLTGPPGAAETRIANVTNGIITPLVVDQTWSAVSPGDYIRGQVQGNLISLIDVTTGTLLLSATDSTITSGYPGVSMQVLNGTPFDHIAASWSGGTFH